MATIDRLPHFTGATAVPTRSASADQRRSIRAQAVAVNVQVLKRYLFLALAAAAMLAVIKPPFPVTGGPKCPRLPFHWCPRLWDETHVPMSTVDDINLYGEGTSWREHWALWALMKGIVLAVLSATSKHGGALSPRRLITRRMSVSYTHLTLPTKA